jgi:GAF domain-containing protein
LPLLSGDQVIGALDIQSAEPNVFHDEDLATFTLIADQLAVAIIHARLITQSDRRIEQIDSLNRQLTRSAWAEVGKERAYSYNLLDVDKTEANQDVIQKKALTSDIMIRGEVIGTLNAAPTEGQDFTEGDEIIIRAVAERVALAIENARLFQETQIALSETSHLYQLSRDLNEADALEDILSAIIESIATDAAGGQVWIFDEYYLSDKPESMALAADVAIAQRKSEDDQDLSGMRLLLNESNFWDNVAGGGVTLVNDIAKDVRVDSPIKKLFSRLKAKSVVVIPLTVRGVWRGMLTIEFPKVRSFNEREGRILTALIDQAGVAIDNRLLLQQTEQEVARNENLYAASRIINTAQTMQDLVYAAVATTNNVELDFGLSLLEGEIDGTGWSKQARIVARSQGGVITEDDFIYPLYLAEDSRLRNREPSVIVDENPKATDVSHFVQFVRQQGYRSMAIFPLFSANRPIALFHLMSYNVIELSDTDMEQYRALTGQMSSQIQIRRLLERTELALDETRRLYVASRAIAGAEEIADVYQAAVEHLARPFVHTQTGDEVDQKTYRISLLLAEPEATPDAPFYKYVYLWDSVGGAVQEFSDHARLTAEDFPYSQITRQSSGLAYFFDVQQATGAPSPGSPTMLR